MYAFVRFAFFVLFFFCFSLVTGFSALESYLERHCERITQKATVTDLVLVSVRTKLAVERGSG